MDVKDEPQLTLALVDFPGARSEEEEEAPGKKASISPGNGGGGGEGDGGGGGDGDVSGSGGGNGSAKRRRPPAAGAMHSRILPDDGHRWHKYGHKTLVDSSYSRAYYRCAERATSRCPVKKTVDFPLENAHELRVTYDGTHNHGLSAPLCRPSTVVVCHKQASESRHSDNSLGLASRSGVGGLGWRLSDSPTAASVGRTVASPLPYFDEYAPPGDEAHLGAPAPGTGPSYAFQPLQALARPLPSPLPSAAHITASMARASPLSFPSMPQLPPSPAASSGTFPRGPSAAGPRGGFQDLWHLGRCTGSQYEEQAEEPPADAGVGGTASPAAYGAAKAQAGVFGSALPSAWLPHGPAVLGLMSAQHCAGPAQSPQGRSSGQASLPCVPPQSTALQLPQPLENPSFLVQPNGTTGKDFELGLQTTQVKKPRSSPAHDYFGTNHDYSGTNRDYSHTQADVLPHTPRLPRGSTLNAHHDSHQQDGGRDTPGGSSTGAKEAAQLLKPGVFVTVPFTPLPYGGRDMPGAHWCTPGVGRGTPVGGRDAKEAAAGRGQEMATGASTGREWNGATSGRGGQGQGPSGVQDKRRLDLELHL